MNMGKRIWINIYIYIYEQATTTAEFIAYLKLLEGKLGEKPYLGGEKNGTSRCDPCAPL